MALGMGISGLQAATLGPLYPILADNTGDEVAAAGPRAYDRTANRVRRAMLSRVRQRKLTGEKLSERPASARATARGRVTA